MERYDEVCTPAACVDGCMHVGPTHARRVHCDACTMGPDACPTRRVHCDATRRSACMHARTMRCMGPDDAYTRGCRLAVLDGRIGCMGPERRARRRHVHVPVTGGQTAARELPDQLSDASRPRLQRQIAVACLRACSHAHCSASIGGALEVAMYITNEKRLRSVKSGRSLSDMQAYPQGKGQQRYWT